LLFVFATAGGVTTRRDCLQAALRAIGAATVQRRGVAGMIGENVGANGVRLEAGDAGDREHAISRNHTPGIKSLSADAEHTQDFGIEATRFERGHNRFRCHHNVPGPMGTATRFPLFENVKSTQRESKL
jgi:hypothetical protein